MTVIKDLGNFHYFPEGCEALRAIGWLGPEMPYSQGKVSQQFADKLRSLCSNPWQPAASAGAHRCELCQFEGPSFSGELFVPFAGLVYAAPMGVLHYVAAHWGLLKTVASGLRTRRCARRNRSVQTGT